MTDYLSEALLTEKELMRLLKIGSRETVARMVRRGQLPPPIFIGGGRKRWLPHELKTHVAERASERERPPAMEEPGRQPKVRLGHQSWRHSHG